MTNNVPPKITKVATDSPYRWAQTVSDAGLARLRLLSTALLADHGPFGSWLHSWCDAEQYRRATGSVLCTARHGFGAPNCETWSGEDLAHAVNGAATAGMQAGEFTAEEFCRRLVYYFTTEAGDRLEKQGTENAN